MSPLKSPGRKLYLPQKSIIIRGIRGNFEKSTASVEKKDTKRTQYRRRWMRSRWPRSAMQRGRDTGEGDRCTPRHSVRLNLLTRFHRPRWQPRGRLPPPVFLPPLCPFSSWLYDYLRQIRPSVRPSARPPVRPTLHRGISAGI